MGHLGHSCRKLLWGTLTGLLWDTQKVTRQVKSPKRAFRHMSKSAKRAFRTRLPPKVKRKPPSEHTRHAALPSSFAIPAPPNNIRSHANPNVTAKRHSPLPQLTTSRFPAPATFLSASTRLTRTKYLACHVTSVTPRNLTIPCACHENRTSTTQNPHKVLRLPRKVTISSHVTASTKFAPHQTFGMISTRSEHTPIHQNRHFS